MHTAKQELFKLHTTLLQRLALQLLFHSKLQIFYAYHKSHTCVLPHEDKLYEPHLATLTS